ncbi:MAG: hypothetical protein UU47_C0017G0013 [candidate division TM6 bacterium GW2011_GWE2_41_16]|nr:MAG: hypothetical protein UU47_C0017G0013 [candidate division TM6 bacterium GW2011_GWE2_41_16]
MLDMALAIKFLVVDCIFKSTCESVFFGFCYTALKYFFLTIME